MKQLLIGFLLGIAVCILTGAELYHPTRGIITRTETIQAGLGPDLKAIVMNQETIFNLVKSQCGTK